MIKTKQEVKAIWKDIKRYDAQIRTIEHQTFKDEPEYFLVEVGLFESLGEHGDILTLDYDIEPTEEEIIKDLKQHLVKTKKELKVRLLSCREEEQLRMLDKVIL